LNPTVSVIVRTVRRQQCLREYLPALRHLKLNGARSRSAALNREIESAEGNVITILDDDNPWDPDHLGNILRDFNDADLV
jgi:cellulose synthase/poly-beta-1,6-N-acetylglucosamine synthase-like glycosyltransferase